MLVRMSAISGLLDLQDQAADCGFDLLAEADQHTDCSLVSRLALHLHHLVDAAHAASQLDQSPSQLHHFLPQSSCLLGSRLFVGGWRGGLDDAGFDAVEEARDAVAPSLQFLLLDVAFDQQLLEACVLVAQLLVLGCPAVHAQPLSLQLAHAPSKLLLKLPHFHLQQLVQPSLCLLCARWLGFLFHWLIRRLVLLLRLPFGLTKLAVLGLKCLVCGLRVDWESWSMGLCAFELLVAFYGLLVLLRERVEAAAVGLQLLAVEGCFSCECCVFELRLEQLLLERVVGGAGAGQLVLHLRVEGGLDDAVVAAGVQEDHVLRVEQASEELEAIG